MVVQKVCIVLNSVSVSLLMTEIYISFSSFIRSCGALP